ncbi:MAG: SprT-like domain-containing protein [Clostridia bacterium]|nr:SprT-like domain-containing protein [Clostridia bacterium]
MDFDAILQDVIRQARMLDIPVPVNIEPHVVLNTRAKKRYGRCIYQQGKYTVELSAYLFDASPLTVHEVIAHEVLHACPGCMNHGALWKAYAARMGARYGYKIERTAKEPLVREEAPKARYILECVSCGMQIPRQKMSRAVEHPELYRCKCGGKLRRSQ